VLAVVVDITQRHPGWVSGTQNAADPFVIATAKLLGAIVVTDEEDRHATTDANMKIPQVASELGVTTIVTIAWFRQLGWQF
jgi:transposase